MLSFIRFRSRLSKLSAEKQKLQKEYREKVRALKFSPTYRDELAEMTQWAMLEDDLLADAISELMTQRLVNSANRNFLPTPDRTDETLWRDSQTQGKVLTNHGMVMLKKTIREEFKNKWELFLMITSALIGIIGALTGLVAVFHK